MTIICYGNQSDCLPSTVHHNVQGDSDAHEDLLNITREGFTIGMSLSMTQDDVFIAFTRSQFLPGDDSFLVASGAITSQCLLALATTYSGIELGQKAVLQQGLKRYGGALDAVHRALEIDHMSPLFDVLEAVMLMSLIEVR